VNSPILLKFLVNHFRFLLKHPSALLRIMGIVTSIHFVKARMGLKEIRWGKPVLFLHGTRSVVHRNVETRT
jgi:hypothetical protein